MVGVISFAAQLHQYIQHIIAITFDLAKPAVANIQLVSQNQSKCAHALALFCAQRTLQYLTDTQFFSHFLRQAKERWQIGQIFSGKVSLWCVIDFSCR